MRKEQIQLLVKIIKTIESLHEINPKQANLILATLFYGFINRGVMQSTNDPQKLHMIIEYLKGELQDIEQNIEINNDQSNTESWLDTYNKEAA